MRPVIKLLNLTFLIVLVLLVMVRFAALGRESQSLEAVVPGDGQLVQAGDLQILIMAKGPVDGAALLFAHGTAAWSGLWEPTLDAIGDQGYRAIGFDMPPLGFSVHASEGFFSLAKQAQRILALVKAMEIKPTMVAHSIGAGPVIEAVMLDQSAFAGLVVVDGAIGLGQHMDQGALPLPLRPKVFREAAIALTMTNPWSTGFFLRRLIHVKEAASDEVISVLHRPLSRQGTTAAYADWLPSLLVAPQDALSTRAEEYQTLSLPVVYIWGAEDTVTPLEQGKELLEITPAAELLTLQGVGHIPQIEDPSSFMLALEQALGLIARTD